MPTITDRQKEELRGLYYEREYSMRMLAEYFGVSLDAVTYAMRRFNFKLRNKKSASAAAFAHKPLSFKVKNNLTMNDEVLKALGAALYWGEGYKAGGKGVDFANGDSSMIKVFLRFLREICRVDEKRLRIYVYCHSQKDIPRLIQHWSRITRIPRSQFSKPYVAKRTSIKGRGMPNGLIHIRYSDKKLLHLILSWIQEYAG